MSLVDTEQVLVVPTELLHKLGYFQGFTGQVDRYLQDLFDARYISYRPRRDMERDPSFKQLIPYVLFRHVTDDGVETVFQYRRGSGQGEQRLHHKRSVGIGGHIAIEDHDAADGQLSYEQGMARELAEEVAINTPYDARLVGLINDDQTDVGKVHLGVVHIFDVERPDVAPQEAEIQEAGFVPVAQLLGELDEFETWSQICMKALFQRSA